LASMPDPSICPLNRHLGKDEDCAPESTFCSRPAAAPRTGGQYILTCVLR